MIYQHDRANNVEIIEPYPNFKFKDDVIKNPVTNPIDNNNKNSNVFLNISFGYFHIPLHVSLQSIFFKNVIIGCTDELACNYDNTANDDGSCTYPEIS